MGHILLTIPQLLKEFEKQQPTRGVYNNEDQDTSSLVIKKWYTLKPRSEDPTADGEVTGELLIQLELHSETEVCTVHLTCNLFAMHRNKRTSLYFLSGSLRFPTLRALLQVGDHVACVVGAPSCIAVHCC